MLWLQKTWRRVLCVLEWVKYYRSCCSGDMIALCHRTIVHFVPGLFKINLLLLSSKGNVQVQGPLVHYIPRQNTTTTFETSKVDCNWPALVCVCVFFLAFCCLQNSISCGLKHSRGLISLAPLPAGPSFLFVCLFWGRRLHFFIHGLLAPTPLLLTFLTKWWNKENRDWELSRAWKEAAAWRFQSH